MPKKAWTFGPAVAWLCVAILSIALSIGLTKPWPTWYLALYALTLTIGSVIAFIAFWIDKRAAGADRRRIPENTLHLIALLGGWPGAVIAQQMLRHKSAKGSFRAALLAIVGVHLIFSGLLAYAFFARLK